MSASCGPCPAPDQFSGNRRFRRGTGSGTVNGHPATISFRLEDNGEPGTRDRVTLTISSPGYPSGDLTVTGAALTKKNLDAAGVSIP